MKIGPLDIAVINDGTAKLPGTYFGDVDWGAHRDLIGPDGTIDVPLGCFLIRGNDRTVLVDAGVGPVDLPGLIKGGDLPAGLEAAGVRREDIDTVVLTHLHIDHIGWTLQDGQPYFPNATIRFGEQDLDQFVRAEQPDQFSAPVITALQEAGRVETIDSDGEIAPGISTIHAPGHTLGHRCVVVSSGDERLFLLGDAVTCPVQLEEPEWSAMSDVDPKLAKRTREALWRELEGSDDHALASHFPGLEFGRVLRGEGRRYFA